MNLLNRLISLIIMGYLAPRASMRAILATGAGFPTAALMLVLAYLVSAIIAIVDPGIARPTLDSIAAHHGVGLAMTFISFFILSAVIHFFCRVSGGTGTREQTQLMVAWHSVVTSLMAPLMMRMQMSVEMIPQENGPPIVGDVNQTALALGVFGGITSLWLLAQYITETHGFRNPLGVVAVVVGVPMGLGFLVFNILAAASVQQQGLG